MRYIVTFSTLEMSLMCAESRRDTIERHQLIRPPVLDEIEQELFVSLRLRS